MNTSRVQALNWYRKIFRAGKEWKGKPEDREYIFGEARKLFRQNMNIKDKESIERKLFEAETRYELAIHYKIPQPRSYNVPQGFKPSYDPNIIPSYMDSTAIPTKIDLYQEDKDF
eukprot:gene5722-9542_t